MAQLNIATITRAGVGTSYAAAAAGGGGDWADRDMSGTGSEDHAQWP